MAEIIKQGECLQDESTSGQGLGMHYTLTDDGEVVLGANQPEVVIPEDISINPSAFEDCPCASSIDPGKFIKEEVKTNGDDDLPF